ncbi:MAG: alpha/beta fold hydrolase [Tatlockia sp.]|jgi:proline iminopeptidase
MHITIPQRSNVPETEIFSKILRKKATENLSWDRDVMVLIHGGPGGNHTIYADIENDLLEMADLIIIDLRGCGLSRKSEVQYCTLEANIDDIDAILKVLNVNNPIIHGCSYGAIVALGYSIKYPDNISKLILSSGAASGNFIKSAKRNLKRLGTPEQIEAAKTLWSGTFKSPEQFSKYYKIMASLYIYSKEQANIPPANAESIPYNVELVNFAFTVFLPVFDFREKLALVKPQTLIFSGKNDWIIDADQAETLHNGIKNSILISLKNCGHFPWKDRKTEFLSNIRLFLEKNNELYLQKWTPKMRQWCRIETIVVGVKNGSQKVQFRI